MSDLTTRTILLEKLILIGGRTVRVSREGNSVTVRFPYAGRVTQEDIRLSANDIRELAQFVGETDHD